MADNLKGIPFSSSDEGDDKIPKAKQALMKTYNDPKILIPAIDDTKLTLDMIYVVNSGYILGNWKAFLSTTLADGMYYEVTYNSNKNETYVDCYLKIANVAIPDEKVE